MRPLLSRGWESFAATEATRTWARAARQVSCDLLDAEAHQKWWRYQHTWFAGVDVLPNDYNGVVSNSGDLAGPAIAALDDLSLRPDMWHRGQVSVVRPGYPKPMAGESEAAFRFRRDRDGAHLDGVLPVGPKRRRMLKEPHAFVLGLPLTETSGGASPMVVWEGSQDVMRQAFTLAFNGLSDRAWSDVDVTEAYQTARRTVFETCRRVEIDVQPGEVYLVHRLALHGVAPWQDTATAPPEGRMVAYFRPLLNSPRDWLTLA